MNTKRLNVRGLATAILMMAAPALAEPVKIRAS